MGNLCSQKKGVIAQINGDFSFGHFVGKIAIEKAVSIARTFGVGFVTATNSNHYGTAGFYTRMAANEGMVAFSTSDTNVVDLAPFGLDKPMIGNNPHSWGIPAPKDAPIILDHACGVTSGGKAKRYGFLARLLMKKLAMIALLIKLVILKILASRWLGL